MIKNILITALVAIVVSLVLHLTGTSIHLRIGTERSEARHGCLPSTTGSASAAPPEPEGVQSQNAPVAKNVSNEKRKMDTALINSVVQLPVSDFFAIENNLRERIKGIDVKMNAYMKSNDWERAF